MEVLGARPICLMSDPEKVSTLDATMAELARLDALVLQLTAEIERTGYAQEIGARDTARFLSTRYLIDLPKARRTVRLATTLDKHPATAAALPDPAAPYADPAAAHSTDNPSHESSTPDETDGCGERYGWRVRPDQAEAIFAILAKVPASVPVENVDFAEQRLIDLAATHTPQQLREAGNSILAILDPDGPEPSEKRAYARESLTWKNSDQGVKFQGFLACENAELFRTVIHDGSKPRKTVDGEPDPRPWSKRQADALTTALSNALNAVPGTRANSTRPTGNGSTSADSANAGTATAGTTNAGADNVHEAGRTETTEGMAAATNGSDPAAAPAQDPLPGVEANESSMSNPNSAAPDPAGANSDVSVVAGHGPKTHISVTIDFNDLKTAASHATGTLTFGDTLSAATVRRLACDAEILPIVLGSKSQPLDVGTTQRLVTQPMRRALNARDKGCVACGAPPNQCEAHHLKHWIDGGITAVSNLVLLCKRDHLDLHSGHWTIQIIDDVVHVARPTWATPKPIPPDKYQPPLANHSARSGQRRLSVVAPARPDPHDDSRGSSHPGDLSSPSYAGSPSGPSGPSGNDPWDENAWDEDASPASHRAANAAPWPPACFDPWGEDPEPSPPRAQTPSPTIPWANDPPPPAPTSPAAIPWANDPPPPPPAAPTIPWADDPPLPAAAAPAVPWADDPPPAPTTPPAIPWAKDPPPPVAAAPTAAWADDPLPAAGTEPTVPWGDDASATRGPAVGDPRAGDATTASVPSADDGFDPWGKGQDSRRPLGTDAGSDADQSRPIADGMLGSVA